MKPLHLGHRSLPTSLASLKALHVLKLSSQQLTGTLPDAYGAGVAFPALEVLDVSYNRLSGRLPLLPGADAYTAQKGTERCVIVMTTACDAHSPLGRKETRD